MPGNPPSAQDLLRNYNRVCEPPPRERLSSTSLWDGNNKPIPEKVKGHFVHEGRIGIQDASKILEVTAEILEKEPNLLTLASPFVIVGDIHGQFYDLMTIFDLGGALPETRYLFLGDYVDRGAFSTESMLYLCVLKICYPTRIYLLRGNHECRHITEYFNFRTECSHKYDLEVYELFCEMFDCLPLAAVVDRKYFCVHAGISPDMMKCEDVMKINRCRELPSSGLMADLCWSDPLDTSMDHPDCKFVYNNARGCSYLYGSAACREFLERNRLVAIIRAHEVQDPGFRLYRKDVNSFPYVFTIFSAPNYCDLYGNKGAILILTKSKFDVKQFNSAPHPFVLPNSLNAISWSMPFLAESTTSMLVAMLKHGGADKDEAESEEEEGEKEIKKAERKMKLKAKLRAYTTILAIFRTLREEAELVCELKGMVAGEKLPTGLLLGGVAALREARISFSKASELDKDVDYKRPPYSSEELRTLEKEEEEAKEVLASARSQLGMKKISSIHRMRTFSASSSGESLKGGESYSSSNVNSNLPPQTNNNNNNLQDLDMTDIRPIMDDKAPPCSHTQVPHQRSSSPSSSHSPSALLNRPVSPYRPLSPMAVDPPIDFPQRSTSPSSSRTASPHPMDSGNTATTPPPPEFEAPSVSDDDHLHNDRRPLPGFPSLPNSASSKSWLTGILASCFRPMQPTRRPRSGSS